MSNEFKLVPVEPTEEMQEVGCSVMPVDWASPFDAGKVYEAMLAAAPQPPALGGEPERLMVSFEDHKFGQSALLEHIESLKKQLQESTALAAPLQAEIERLKARCDELEHRASDVVEGFDGEQLPGAMTMRIRKLKAALSKPAGSEKV